MNEQRNSMKRVFKIMLSLLVILSGITVTTSMTATPVIARTVGDYTYTDNSDGTVTPTMADQKEN